MDRGLGAAFRLGCRFGDLGSNVEESLTSGLQHRLSGIGALNMSVRSGAPPNRKFPCSYSQYQSLCVGQEEGVLAFIGTYWLLCR